MSKIHQKVTEAKDERSYTECALGFVLYEFVRRLRPKQFERIWQRNISENKSFDDIIDEMIEREAK